MEKDTLVVVDTVVSPACGYHGYCDFEATRHYNASEGQTQGTISKGERHHYYKRSMRLGYDY